MAGLIFNFGRVGKFSDSGDGYEVKLLASHPDPDFYHWTFGDYPTKGSKGNMKSFYHANEDKFLELSDELLLSIPKERIEEMLNILFPIISLIRGD